MKFVSTLITGAVAAGLGYHLLKQKSDATKPAKARESVDTTQAQPFLDH
jgi:hypothetical protein